MKAYNDQEVQSDVRTIDPNAIEPAHLPFELHVTSLALINEQRKRDQRKEKFKNALLQNGLEEENGEGEDDEEIAFWETDVEAAEKAKEAAKQAKEEAIRRAEEFITSKATQVKQRQEEEEADRIVREEISAFWYVKKYQDRPTNEWCSISLTVPRGQESAGGRVQDVDLNSISMNSLEVGIFRCIPDSSRIIRMGMRRTTEKEESENELIDSNGMKRSRRFCCTCQLSDIQSVLSILRRARLGTLQAQTVHGHFVHLELHGHRLLVPKSKFSKGFFSKSSIHEFGRVLNDLDPFGQFKEGHLKQKKIFIHHKRVDLLV